MKKKTLTSLVLVLVGLNLSADWWDAPPPSKSKIDEMKESIKNARKAVTYETKTDNGAKIKVRPTVINGKFKVEACYLKKCRW